METSSEHMCQMTVDIQSFKSKFKKGTVVNFLRILNLSVQNDSIYNRGCFS